MPTLRNTSGSSFEDLRRNAEREFTEEEMKSPAVQRALRVGRLVEVDEPATTKESRAQQRGAKR